MFCDKTTEYTPRKKPTLFVWPACLQVQAEQEELQQAAGAGRAEKDEMGRLYNELLNQLRTAEEEKEELRVGGRRGGTFILDKS